MEKMLRRPILIISLILLLSISSYSQIGDIANLLTGSVNDAELMFTEYLRPVANAMGANLSSGWYNTAESHKLGGFHLNFTANIAFVPEEHQTYNLNDLDLSEGINFDNNGIAKTAAGSIGSETQIWYETDVPGIGRQEIVRFDHPGGSGFHMLPTPMINAGVGLVKGTELLGRYMPKVKYGKDKANYVNLWGVGIKHDLKQWIPFVKRLPILNLAVSYGYTNVNFHSDIKTLTPAMLNAQDLTTTADWSTQDMDMKFQSHTASLLVGASLPVVSFYGGAGISITKANLDLKGDFPMPTIITDIGDPNFGEVVVTDNSFVTDPLNIEIRNQDGGTTKPRFNIGVLLKFTVITFQIDYTWANYSVATAGIGISFR
jgi:hypothetical protein